MGTIDLVTGLQFTRGTGTTIAPSLVGVGIKNTVNSSGVYLGGVPIPALTSYMAVWHGVMLGAISGSTPKLLGIANSSTSQSLDVLGLEINSSTELQINFKSDTTNSNRTFANSVPPAGVPVTFVAVYDVQSEEVRLHVCADGKLTSYSSTVSSAAIPVITGTEVICVGPDQVEVPSRFTNTIVALSLIAQSAGDLAAEMDIARNPWSLFQPAPAFYVDVASAGGSSDTTVTTSQAQTAAAVGSTGVSATTSTSQGQTAAAAGSISASVAGTTNQGQTAAATASTGVAGANTTSQGQSTAATASTGVSAATSTLQGQTTSAASTLSMAAAGTTNQAQSVGAVMDGAASVAVSTSQGQSAAIATSVGAALAGSTYQGQSVSAAGTTSVSISATTSQGQTAAAAGAVAYVVASGTSQGQSAAAAAGIQIACSVNTAQAQRQSGVIGDLTPDGEIVPDVEWFAFIVPTQQSKMVVKSHKQILAVTKSVSARVVQ